MFQRLVHFNAASQPIPGISNWEKVSTTHYRFTLNTAAQPFHHHHEMTSEDVKATYDFIINPNNASPLRTSVALIERITSPTKKQINFFLKHPNPLFPAYLTAGIVPKSLIETKHSFNEKPIGSGTFKFIRKTPDGKVLLERQKDQLPVTFVYVPDPTVRVLKLLRGELDIIQNDIQPELVKHLAKDATLTIDKHNGTSFFYIGINMQDDILKNKDIRLAIALGINRQEIIDTLYSNTAQLANGILPTTHWAGNSQLVAYEYQPEKAKKLLTKAGYTQDTPLKLTFKTSSDPFRLRLATIYQHQLKKIGIQLDIRSYDWGTFFGDIKAGRFQLYSLAWVGINTPDIFRYTSHSQSIPPSGANRGHFIDTTTDNLIELAESQLTPLAQGKYYAKLQAHLLKELPYIPLWTENNVIIKRKSIKNYQTSPLGNYDGLQYVEYTKL